MEQLITKKQLSKLHVVLAQAGMTESKKELIYQVSNRRTTSSTQLTYSEVTSLIDYLEDILGTDKLRRKVFSLAYEAGIIYGDTPDDKKMNAAKLNRFLLDRGTVKKELKCMNKLELTKVVSQFSSIVKHNKEAINRKERVKIEAEVDKMLNELKIGLKVE